MTRERTAFGDEDEEEIVRPKKTLKINNANSTVTSPLPKEQEVDFRNNINKLLSEEEEQKKLAFKIASKFMNILKDKTLNNNKNIIIREEEKKSIMDMIDFARVINSDENQEENLGTMSIISTMLKAIFYQRDKINENNFEISKLKTEIAALTKQIAEMKR